MEFINKNYDEKLLRELGIISSEHQIKIEEIDFVLL